MAVAIILNPSKAQSPPPPPNGEVALTLLMKPLRLMASQITLDR
jgi:hypothetical protein